MTSSSEYIGPIGIIHLPGTIENLHSKWNPPEYVVDLWSTGCSVKYLGHEEYLRQKEEILLQYSKLLER